MGDRVFDPRRGLALHVPQGRPQTAEVAQAGRRWQTWQTHALGANSLLAKAGEHVPLLADGLVCLHKYRGQTEAEERARAFSLQKHLSKDGALTKLAELLPGSNLLAAAMLHIRGHHREAQEALNLLKNWRDCGSADGALAKVAEMLPGVDVIAFGVHVNAGNFAQALRSISKTQWTDVTGDVIISFDLATLHGFSVSDIQASNLEVIPVASFMYGGLLDIVTNLIEVNSRGQKRSRFLRAAAARSPTNPVHRVKETLLGCCNEALEDLTQETLPEMIPELLDSAAMAATSYFQSQKGYMSFLLPKALPAKPHELEKEFQRSLEKVTVCHKRAIPVEVVRQKEIGKFGSAEVIATSTCCLGLGLQSAGLACLAGCFCGFSQLRRWLQRQFVPLVNSQNEQAWNDATKEPTQVFIRRPSPMEAEKSESQPSDRRMPFALIAELRGEAAERLSAALGRYFCHEMPLMKLLGHRGFHLLRRWMMGLLTPCSDGFDGVPVVPLVLHAEVGEGLYSICGQGLWLPSMSFALVLECHLSAEPFVSTIQIVVTDDLVDQVLDVLQTGIRGIDLRQLDTRLGGFAEPINLHCKALLSWPQASSPRLDLRDIKIHLQLPS